MGKLQCYYGNPRVNLKRWIRKHVVLQRCWFQLPKLPETIRFQRLMLELLLHVCMCAFWSVCCLLIAIIGTSERCAAACAVAGFGRRQQQQLFQSFSSGKSKVPLLHNNLMNCSL